MVVSNYASTNSVALASRDYVELQARAGETQGKQPRGSQPDLQDYDGAGAYRFKDEAHALLNNENHLAVHAVRTRQLIARGAVLRLRVGRAVEVAVAQQSYLFWLKVLPIC